MALKRGGSPRNTVEASFLSTAYLCLCQGAGRVKIGAWARPRAEVAEWQTQQT